jgi:hypothetical protein
MENHISLTSDTPSWTDIRKIKTELREFDENVMQKKYSDISIEIAFCFRCLSDSSGWESKAIFHTKELWLGLDVVMQESQFIPIKKNIAAQREIMGKTLFPFFKEVVSKYSKKIPYLKEHGNSLVEDLRIWLIEKKWLPIE